ncbi:hypothetical protein KDA23_07525, partial [Candidatus Saccharibacteria bacterium]|nr:hypothetical protein [Candidatus Saccharibacteria bacterium]
YTSVMMGVYRGAAGGSSTCTWQRVNFSVGAVDNPPGEPEFYMQLAGNLSGGTAANQQWFADFPVEDVRTASNGDVTFSIWLHGSSAGTIAVQPIQLFGSGGSSAVYVTGQEIDVTTTWTRYTLTFSIPSMNGKTIGTASSLRLRIYKQAGSTIQAAVNLPNAINFTGNLNMWAAQLERGSIMTDFERRPISLEQRLIERYFQMWTAITTEYLATGMCVTTQQAWFPIQLKTPLRSAPTMSINNLHVFDVSNNWTVVAMDATLIGTDTVAIRLIIGTASFGVTRPAIIRMPSSGSFVKADARL